jgi:GT2 family glycosyltransferase
MNANDSRTSTRTPSVAAVVVNYRTPEQTVACVRSLQAVRYAPFDVLVVDNDSGDGSADWMAQRLPGTRVLRASRNGGYTAGNNLGVREAMAAGAEYVLLVNPDALVVNPDFVGELVAAAERRPDAGALGPRVFLRSTDQVQNTVLRFPWLHRRIVDALLHRLLGRPMRSGARLRAAEALNGVCVLFRAEALRDVGLLDDRTFAYIEDVDWGWRAQARGWRRLYVPVDSIVHLQKKAGYERLGEVDYLLKRNTLYFLLKSGKYVQAAGYSAAIVGAAALHAAAAPRKGAAWLRRIAAAYVRLWTGRWEAVMGPPRLTR